MASFLRLVVVELVRALESQSMVRLEWSEITI